MSYKEVIDYIVDEFNENDLEYEVEAAVDDEPYDYWITIEGDTSLADEIICSYVGDHYEWVKDKDGNRKYCKVDTQTQDELEEDKKKKPKVTNADVEADMEFFNDAMGMGNVSISESGESKAKRLFKHPKFSQKIRTFAILTFYNQDKKTQTKEVNKEQQKELKKILSNSDETERILKQKTPYYKVKGKYDNVEQSFIIYNISLEEAKSLAKTGKQQSFIFGKNEDGVLTFEFWANASKNDYKYVKVDERDNFNILDDEAENYYSQISKDFKFSIPFEQFEVSQDELVEKYINSGLTEDEINFYIEESMNDTYNNKYRTNCRTRLVNSKFNSVEEDDTSDISWANDFNIF